MWTEERVELLRKLWAEGLSASQIAGRLGEVTRNAVIGKVHRLGLAARSAPHYRLAGHGLPRGRRVERGSVRPVSAKPLRSAPAPRKLSAPVLVFATADVELASLGLGLLDLTPASCRWPFGDPRRDVDFSFCGRDAEGPYCDHHARIAFRPAARRGRR